MINPLDELSDIYLGQISEADNSPEAIKARVMQHVRAIRYRARKEGDQLNKAYNDYMAGQAGISATEKSMVKERLGLTGGAQHQEGMAYGLSRGTGKPSGPMAAFGKKKTKKTKPTVTIDKPDKLVSLRVSKEGYYNWRHELSEYSDSMPVKVSDAEKRITEKKVKNKVTVNPAQGQAESFAKELGGQLLEACEVFQIFEVDDDQIQLLEVKDRKGKGSGTKDACYHKVKSRYSVWPSAYASGALVKCRRVGAANWGNSTKKEDVQWKDIKYKAKSGESTFLSDSDGNIAFEIVDVIAPAVQEAKGMSEDYETKKKEEIMGALKKRDLKQKVKEKIAADIIKRKGDVSKSDDRYAYESVEVVSEGPLGALAGGALGAAVGGPVGALAGAALGSKVDVLGGGKKKTKATKPTPAPKLDPKPFKNVEAEKAKAAKRIKLAKMMEKEKLNKEGFSNWRETLDEKCWKGYEKKGMKTMFGKRYPNCVKKKTKSEEVEFQEKLDLKKADMGDVVKDFYKSDAPQFKGRSKEKRREMAIAAKLTAERGKLPEEVVTEVSKKTLGSYVKKASTDLATRSIKHGMTGGTETGGDPDSSENVEKINKRHSGIMKAVDKLKKESFSANPAQQAAIAIAKKERKQDLKVAQKKKMKEETLPEAKVDQGKDDASKINTRNQRAFGNRRGQKGGMHRGDDMEARRYNTEKGRGVKMKGKKDKTPINYHKRDSDKRVDALLKGMKEEVVTELNRFEKEKGMDTKTGKPVTKGGTAKNDRAFQAVMKKFGKQRMGANQPKKVRGAKNPNETSPTKQKMTRMKAAKASSRAFETRAKKAGYKTAQDYANVVARYGSEDNMKKGRGLGT